jgi:hypothetical protein
MEFQRDENQCDRAKTKKHNFNGDIPPSPPFVRICKTRPYLSRRRVRAHTRGTVLMLTAKPADGHTLPCTRSALMSRKRERRRSTESYGITTRHPEKCGIKCNPLPIAGDGSMERQEGRLALRGIRYSSV